MSTDLNNFLSEEILSVTSKPVEPTPTEIKMPNLHEVFKTHIALCWLRAIVRIMKQQRRKKNEPENF